MRNKFRVEIKDGKTIDTLNRGRGFFASKNIDIVKYKYSIDSTKTRHYNSVKKTDLKVCEVCGANLFEFDQHEDNDLNSVMVRQKKMLIYIDDEDKPHHTCYRLNACLRKVGFTATKIPVVIKTIPRNLVEFANLDIELIGSSDEEFIKSAERSYERYVDPFIMKWAVKDIDKRNVLQFVVDADALENHLIFYEDDAAKSARKKIYKLIGVV